MIVIPNRRFPRSVNKHRVDLQVLSDWIEASVLFRDDELSRADVCDCLLEEERYDKHDMAMEIVSDAWEELERRASLCTGSYAIDVTDQWVRRVEEPANKSAHVFCVLLSISAGYDWWTGEFGRDFTDQGELFELLTEHALKTMFPQWSTLLTGWGRSNTDGFTGIARQIAQIAGNGSPCLDRWDHEQAKDMTLDILMHRPFPDGRQGFPYFMLQCASGANWETKLRDPDLSIWKDIIRPATVPMRGFAMPFCCSDRQFEQSCVKSRGLVLDRCRLLGAGEVDPRWLPDDICGRINEWAAQRVKGLLSRSE